MKKLSIITAGLLLSASTIMAGNLNACMGCHGKQFEKKALNVSKVVKDMSKEDIAKALKGYKAGAFGGNMKSIMSAQVSKYSDVELDKMADEIYKLNHKEEAKEIRFTDPDIKKPSIKKMEQLQKVPVDEQNRISQMLGAPVGLIIFDGIKPSGVPGYDEIIFHTVQRPIKHIIYKDKDGNYIAGMLITKDGKNITQIEEQNLNKEIQKKMEAEQKAALTKSYQKVLNGQLKDNIVRIKGFNDKGDTLVVFSDPKCPFCIQFEEKILPRLTKDYKEIIVVMYPLVNLRGHETSLDRSVWAVIKGQNSEDGMKIVKEASHKPYSEIKKDLESFDQEKVTKVKNNIKQFISDRTSGVGGTPTVIDKNGNNVTKTLFQKYGN